MADARKPTQRYLSGRVKIVNNAGLHTDRHLYVSPGEVEPNLGYPGEKSLPLSNTYFQLVTIPNGDTYDRYWQQQPGLQPGGISVFDEGTIIGVANSISKLNFVGSGVTAIASGTISTITIDPSSARVKVSENPPTSPTPVNGDLWWDSDIGELYVYYVGADGAQWVETSGGSETVTISDDAPSNPNAGDLWWESDTGRLKIYYNDGDSAQWVDAASGLLDEITGVNRWGTSNSGIHTLTNVGIGTTNPTEKLVVYGDARVTGILTIGTSSLTLDGTNNVINVGTGVTVYGNVGIVSATGGLHIGTTQVISSDGVWTGSNNGIAGPQGAQGVQGAAGSGSPGGTGPQGAQGVQGATGSSGSTGPQGNQGVQGATGSTGPQGNQGVQGATGSTGPQGNQGATGSTGPQGAQGDAGIVTPEQYGAIAKPVIEPETRTWYDAMATKPKREHLRSMDMLVKRLKWTGIWNELDTLYVFASHNKADSLINVVNTGIATLTEATTATFTAGKGWTAGSGGRLATEVNFNTFASQYEQNSAHVGVFMLTDGQRDNSPIAGIADGTEDGYIVPHRADTDVMRARVNTSDGDDFTNTRSDGSFIISRNSSTALVAYRNGFQLGTATNTSEAVPSQPLEVLNVTGSDSSGTIAFLHTGDEFNESQARSFSWMMQEYVNEVEAGYDEGATVTTGMLDRTVGVVTNTTAMKNFISVAVGSTVGILGDETYLINDTLTLPDSHNLQGVLGKTTIRAHSDSDASESMNNERPVIRVGLSTAQTFGGKVDGLIVDYNIDRTTGIGSTTGGFELDTDGTAFALHNVQGGRYTNITTMSAKKHGFDILGDNYNRSGSDGTYNQKLNLVSRDIYVDKIVCMGMGDDGFTTHGVEYITGGSVWGEFCRATFSPRNSNAVEIDDYSRYINIKDMGGRFVHSVVEVKGHGDAAPAEHVYIGRIFAEHSTRGLLIRHLDHGDSGAQEGVSPFEGDVVIDNVYYRAPLVYHGQLPSGTSGSGSNGLGLESQAGFIYAYDRVQIGNFTARCDGADNVITTEVFQIGGGGSNLFVNRIDISDFTSATQGLDLYGSNPGAYSMFNSIRIHNSGTVEGVDIGGNTDAVIGSYAITKTGSNGSTGIDGHSGVKLGQGFVSGYTTSTDV